MHLGSCRLRVDVDETGLRLALEPGRRGEAGREDRRREPERHRVGTGEGFVEIREPVKGRDGPEDLLTGQERVVADALEHGG